MILASLLAQQLHAQSAPTSDDDLNRELVFGIAASVNRFNSSYSVVDSGSLPITVDGESDFRPGRVCGKRYVVRQLANQR